MEPTPGTSMYGDQVLRDIARSAHTLWCRAMMQRGWTCGPTFDGDKKVHDALVPFERLHVRDQRTAIFLIKAEALDERLAELIDYPRGPERPFSIDEMRVGLPVVLAEESGLHAGEISPDLIGRVERWTTDDEGDVDLICVRWSDGRVEEFVAPLRELARAEELGG